MYAGELAIAQRLAPLPRAYVVYAAEVAADESSAVARVLTETFDVRNVAVVEAPVGLPTVPAQPATRAALVEYGPLRVVVQANAAAPGLLLLGDQFYPGWQATVDGRPAPIVAANYVWRGVRLEAGAHTVVFTLRPASLYGGLALSALGVLGLGLVALWDWRSRRRRR